MDWMGKGAKGSFIGVEGLFVIVDDDDDDDFNYIQWLIDCFVTCHLYACLRN